MASNKRVVMEVYDDGSISTKPATTWEELVRFVNSVNAILKQCQQAQINIIYEQQQATLDGYRRQYEATSQAQFQWTPMSSEGEDQIDGMNELHAAIMSITP